MNRPKVRQEVTSIRKFTLIGTILLLLLMLLFFVVTIFGNQHLSTQMALLTEHPFTVNGDIGNIRTNLAQMRVRTERLQAYNNPEDVERVNSSLNNLNKEMEKLLDEVEELYLGPNEDTVALRNSYNEIIEAHELLLQFAALSDSDTDKITEYEEKHLYPLYNKFEENAQNILSYVRNTQQNIFNSANKMGRTTLTWSIVLIVATASGLLYFQSSIRKLS